ncbi:lppC lipofamily protein, partial [Escherichia coli 90.2281]
SLG